MFASLIIITLNNHTFIIKHVYIGVSNLSENNVYGMSLFLDTSLEGLQS